MLERIRPRAEDFHIQPTIGRISAMAINAVRIQKRFNVLREIITMHWRDKKQRSNYEQRTQAEAIQ